MFGIRARTDKTDTADGINVAGRIVKFNSKVKLLDVTLDTTLSMNQLSHPGAVAHPTLSDNGCRQEDSSRSRHRPP